ncbi:hypothetical protein EVAR_2336_1 [Eumeta japonica]|uniref:Uncharacterized protein n=1 Tax=Eumeta variegata TaxID=151549 RepID=A0A4C1SGQ5_EUMVA|nr:hypothetical protein EVAR_2336_1 [Eumeta japonica]
MESSRKLAPQPARVDNRQFPPKFKTARARDGDLCRAQIKSNGMRSRRPGGRAGKGRSRAEGSDVTPEMTRRKWPPAGHAPLPPPPPPARVSVFRNVTNIWIPYQNVNNR